MHYATDITCHTNAPHRSRPVETWEARGGGVRRCTYCGSIAPEDLVALAARPGVTIELADMKHGFPHKLYLHGVSLSCGSAKFYLEHLTDVGHDDEAFQAVAAVVRLSGVELEREEGRVKYRLIRRVG
jgi:hypothetical protein